MITARTQINSEETKLDLATITNQENRIEEENIERTEAVSGFLKAIRSSFLAKKEVPGKIKTEALAVITYGGQKLDIK